MCSSRAVELLASCSGQAIRGSVIVLQGAAKYGFLGLLYVLRWHETGNRPLPPEENQFWVQQTSQALAQKLREKRHALLRPDAPADELALVMLEVNTMFASYNSWS